MPSLDKPSGIEIMQKLLPTEGVTVAPPTYDDPLELHKRLVDGKVKTVIELDSVGSSANRIEEVFQQLYEAEGSASKYPLPVSSTTVTADGLERKITTLEMPHRLFDAWLRNSETADGSIFEESPQGIEIIRADNNKLDSILEASAHDLLFGSWDAHRTGPNGQVRIARSLSTTVIGILPEDATPEGDIALTNRGASRSTDSFDFTHKVLAARVDPFNLAQDSEAAKNKEQKKLSEQGLSSIPPQRSGWRVAIESGKFIGYLNFPSLRRLGFEKYDSEDVRVVLALLGLYGVVLRSSYGWDLRSNTRMKAAGPLEFKVTYGDGRTEDLNVPVADLEAMLNEAIKKAGIQDRSANLNAGSTLNKLVSDAIASVKAKKK